LCLTFYSLGNFVFEVALVIKVASMAKLNSKMVKKTKTIVN